MNNRREIPRGKIGLNTPSISRLPAATSGLLSLALILGTTMSAVSADPSVVAVPGPAWTRHTIDASSLGADGVKLGDVNRDGLPDIATGWEEGGEVRVYLNPGPRAAKDPWPRVTAGQAANVEDAIFADVDGDGLLDVVSCCEGKTRTVFWHRFSGDADNPLDTNCWATVAFPATQNSQAWMQAAVMDLDGQHHLDLLLASKNRGGAVGWLQSPKQPAKTEDWQYHPLRSAGWVMSLIPTDLNGDGQLDVVLSDRKGTRAGLFWLENPGPAANRQSAPWKEHALGALGREVMFADVADFNCDSLADVAVAVKPVDVFLFLQGPRGQWQESVIHLDGTRLGDAKAVKLADVNGDRLTDLIFTCENAKGDREGVVWLEQQADGPWRQHALGGPAGVKYDLVQTLDLDADGDLDVITCEERDQLGVIWYENPR
jgi:hypothetical protein